jgi:hypothetical protein
MQSRIDRYRNKLNSISNKGFKTWKPEKNQQYTLRIMPPLNEEDDFWYEARTHYIANFGENGRGRYLRCLPNNCPVCAVSLELRESENETLNNIGYQARPMSNYYLNLLDINDPEAGVQVWKTGSDHVIKELLGYFLDAEYGDFTDPDTGRNIRLFTEPRGKSYTYKVSIRPRETKIDKSLLKECKNLKKFAPAINESECREAARFVQELAQASGYKASAYDDDEDEYLKPVRKKKPVKKKTNKASKGD